MLLSFIATQMMIHFEEATCCLVMRSVSPVLAKTSSYMQIHCILLHFKYSPIQTFVLLYMFFTIDCHFFNAS